MRTKINQLLNIKIWHIEKDSKNEVTAKDTVELSEEVNAKGGESANINHREVE